MARKTQPEAAPKPAPRGAFHLLRPGQPGSVGADAAPTVLEVPAAGVLTLGPDSGGPEGEVAFEALGRPGLDVLLALGAAGAGLRVNGLPALRVAVLRPGDELRLGAEAPLHVDFLRAEPFMLAGPEHLQASCQLCRAPIEEGRRIYRCACEALTHADEHSADARESSSEGELMDCALGSCTGCGRPIETESGYLKGGFDGIQR